jgi:parallel beta-helix repeat protein
MAILFLIIFTIGSEAAIITVDDDGPAMFSKIQDGINASDDGDTVYVYNGTYYENVVVNRSINLTGENQSITIIDGGGIGSVVLMVEDWVNVTGFNILNSGMNISDAGVRLDGVQNCNISHNNISHNKEMGIHLNYSHSNTIFDNIFTYNWDWGIYLEYADFNFIWNNLIDTNGKGIGIFYSSYEIIELNNITETGGYGIFFYHSGNSSVKNNTIIDNAAAGVEADVSYNLTVGWNLIGREKYGCTYGVVLWGGGENIILYNTLQGNGYGVYLSHSSKNDIMNNNISGSIDIGIDLLHSNQNDIINNSFENNMEGIKLWKSHDNKVIDNIIPISIGQGLTCENSNRTTIAGNDFSEGYWWGMYFSWCSYNNITNNNLSAITGFPPFEYGIYMEYSQNNNITHNTISSNQGYGIQLLSSSDNTITLNNISYNVLGINISNSLNNRIYHNSFFNNTNQAYDDSNNGNFWDNGYPSGGNYWSDYTGQDTKRGPNQDIPGSDGIGDTPYEIDSDSRDNYPLMEPYQPPNGSNNPPIITTVDVKTAFIDILYLVDYEAYDHENDPLTWILITNASMLSINTTTGVLSGTPDISHIGSYWVNVSVDDGNGGMDYHNFTLTVFDRPVVNLNTGEKFFSIQEAIDDPDTLDGHTIFVKEGTYYENVFVTKAINLIGENKENTIIDAGGAWDAVIINANGVKVSGFTLKNSGDYPLECAGVRVTSNYNNISGNIMISNRNGIFLEEWTNNNIIYGNQISNNDYGIWLNYSDSNHILNNLIISNIWDGIVLNSYSNNNNVTSNSIMSCNTGIYLYSSFNNNVLNNSISSIDWIGIRIFFSNYNFIERNNLFQCNGTAITLDNSQENNVTFNEMDNNGYGISMDSSSANNITKNNIYWNSEWGIYLVSSSDNHIYYNNILNNTNQAFDDSTNGNQWDNGYPFGGNYWSNYLGQDNFKGPNQDIPGIDGIGDTPYIIDSDSQDNYPLMVTWEDFLILDLEPPVTNHDYDGMWHTSDFTITLTATDNSNSVEETFYRINNGLVKSVSIDGQPFISTENDNNTLEYWSVDIAGNEEVHKFLYNIKLDKTFPTSSNDYDGLEHYTDFVITLTASDGLSGIEDIYYKINEGTVLSVSINGLPIITVESENNSLEYWAVDVAGNIEDHHNLYGIKLNKTYPDLAVTPDDIHFSKSRLIEGMEVYINTTIHNIGNCSAQATVKVYDGEPGLGLLIGEAIVNVEGQGSDIASIVWSPSPGVHNIHVLISDVIPYEPFTHNNRANKSVNVEIPPILVLSMGDLNIFRFESGEERTVPVYVSCYNNSATNIKLLILDNRGLNITVVTPPQNLSKDEMAIFYLRIKVPDLEEGEEFKEEDILLQVVSDEIRGNSESLDIIVGKSAADFLGLFLLLGGAAAGAGTLAFIGGTEIGKYALFAASMSLYTRLKSEDVLDQETRGMIRGYIIANPGEHYNAIKRALDLKNGTLAYHLKTLEKEKLIKSVRDGRYKRFYPPNMKVSENVVILNKAQEVIMGKIIDNPGISQKELANIVGLSTSTINYHISVMANAGFIRVERKGKHTMCFPEDEAA